MASRIASSSAVSLLGLDGHIINVEANITDGIAAFTIVGLPDTSVNESKARVLTAFRTSRIYLSEVHITVNLSPASLPKRGSSFDLAIASAILASYETIDRELVKDIVFIGEIGLDGRIHPVKGVLPMCEAARKSGIKKVCVAVGNEAEAKLVEEIEVISFGHLGELIRHFGGKSPNVEYTPVLVQSKSHEKIPVDKKVAVEMLDFADVIGQDDAKKALEIAAAGFHNVMMYGPPGTGKSMLAARLPSILPDLTTSQAVEVTSIHSISKQFTGDSLILRPPFEAPHHTATAPAIIGGGTGVGSPGSVSRADWGVLFLDEAPEFSPRVLQTLRQPLESGLVVIDRARGQVTYPAHFQLILAANPCPCGMAGAGNGGSDEKCRCSSLERRKYLSRLSGPLLDRVDIFTNVLNVSRSDIERSQKMKGIDSGGQTSNNRGSDIAPESSAVIKERVIEARKRAEFRLKNTPWSVNAQVPGSYLRGNLKLSDDVLNALHNAVDQGVLSLRGADRALRISWTIADLSGLDRPGFEELAIAMDLKGGMNDL
jgi:magnesium chelatase family protein